MILWLYEKQEKSALYVRDSVAVDLRSDQMNYFSACVAQATLLF